ncbi:hypothetical protein [Alysiella crassa]|nr:hypothetical protein [Alysiella crassa]
MNQIIRQPETFSGCLMIFYSGFNLNQDKATATAVYTLYIRELERCTGLN